SNPGNGNGSGSGSTDTGYRAFCPRALNTASAANPTALFDVIVTGTSSASTLRVGLDTAGALFTYRQKGTGVKQLYIVISGPHATLSGQQIQNLLMNPDIAAVTPVGHVASNPKPQPAPSHTQLCP